MPTSKEEICILQVGSNQIHREKRVICLLQEMPTSTFVMLKMYLGIYSPAPPPPHTHTHTYKDFWVSDIHLPKP